MAQGGGDEEASEYELGDWDVDTGGSKGEQRGEAGGPGEVEGHAVKRVLDAHGCICEFKTAVKYARGPHHGKKCKMWRGELPVFRGCQCSATMLPYLRSERGNHHDSECTYRSPRVAPRRVQP